MAKANTLLDVRGSGFFSVLRAELDSIQSPCDVKMFAARRLSERCQKRYRVDNPALKEKALAAFVDTNEAVGLFRVDLPGDIVANAREFILHSLWRASTSFGSPFVQDTLYMSTMFDLWAFGPGASASVKGTHTAEKISQPMTCTVGSRNLVENLRLSHPYLRRNDLATGLGVKVVDGSKLGFVPKNEEVVRTIATEPSGNMCLQLAAGRYLERALLLIGIDLSTQPSKNQRLCGSAELFDLSTIDLRSASDRISIDLVRQLLPAEWFRFLMNVRSDVTVLPDGNTVPLNMISTMGNGTTFPLMTLIITSLIYAYRCRIRNSPTLRVDWSRTAVFGDDIIIPSREYDVCCEMLTAAGFVINHDKSYRTGPFRESCGLDAYSGVDVTPFYVKSLQSHGDIYVAINQLLSWSEKTRIELVDSLRYLFGLLPKGRAFFVPEWEAPYSGVLTSGCDETYKLLVLKPFRRRLLDETYLVPLACGGYVESRGSNVFYAPRTNSPKYVVARRKLPKGFLTGWDPCKRSQEGSDFVRLVISKV